MSGRITVFGGGFIYVIYMLISQKDILMVGEYWVVGTCFRENFNPD